MQWCARQLAKGSGGDEDTAAFYLGQAKDLVAWPVLQDWCDGLDASDAQAALDKAEARTLAARKTKADGKNDEGAPVEENAAGPQCKNGHRMTLLHGPPSDPAYGGRVGKCDGGGRGGCRCTVDAEAGYFHCDPCQADCCRSCAPASPDGAEAPKDEGEDTNADDAPKGLLELKFGAALGVEDGSLPDSAFRTSHHCEDQGGHHARLNGRSVWASGQGKGSCLGDGALEAIS